MDSIPIDFKNRQLTQKNNGQENLDLKSKFAFVNRLHSFDLALRRYFATVNIHLLEYVPLQFVNCLFILYFLGLRPGHREKENTGNEATYTGLLTLTANNVRIDKVNKNQITFDFIEKTGQKYVHTFLFPPNMAKALGELLIINRIKYGPNCDLFPHFVPEADYCKENFLFLYNVRMFFGCCFSYRTFRIHSISVIAEQILAERTLLPNTTANQFEQEIRLALRWVRENFSNHSYSLNIVNYVDFRVILLAALKQKFHYQHIPNIVNMWNCRDQNVSWTIEWLMNIKQMLKNNRPNNPKKLFIF